MINTDKFSWKENEFVIVKTQCEACVFHDKDNRNSCIKFEQKPENILSNEKKCPYLKLKGEIEL